MMFAPVMIGKVLVAPGLVLSPMSGVTCGAFRRLLKELNPGCIGLLVSEFVSVEAIIRRVPRTLEMMRFSEAERPFAVQIFGADAQRMSQAARMVQDLGADIIEINCGCPAPKVFKKGGGADLMRRPLFLAEILRAVRRAISIPLTVKMRSGWDKSSVNAGQVARIAQAEGADAVCIHPRTRTDLYRGAADWQVVWDAAKELAIPVFGSGDVVDRQSACQRLYGEFPEKGGSPPPKAAGLYIGRAALDNPFLFSELVHGRRVDLKGNLPLVLATIDRYCELLKELSVERAQEGKLKQLVGHMCRGYKWRKDFCRARSLTEQAAILQRVRSEQMVSGHPAQLPVGRMT